MTEITSFKKSSRIITIIMAILVYLGTISVETWQTILPTEYVYLAPGIVIIIGFFINQLSEEKRVTHAEQLVHQEYQSTPVEAQTEEDIISTNDYELSEDPTENLQENNMEVDDDTA